MEKIGKWFILVALLIATTPALAQVNVEAVVDRNEMELGDTFTLTISISSSETVPIQPPTLPEMGGVELLHQWGAGTRTSSTFTPSGGFKTQITQSFSYQMAASNTGSITIAPIEIVVEGKSYRTKPIVLKVHEPGSQAMAQQDPNQAAPGAPPSGMPQAQDPMSRMEDLFNQLLNRPFGMDPSVGGTVPSGDEFAIVVEVDKKRVFEGEGITASWYLMTRGQVLDIDTLKYPDLEGFWKEDIEIATHLNFRQEIINGVPYRKALLASYALFPIKPGTVKIDPYRAKATVLAGGFGPRRVATKESQNVAIEVLPLPKEGRPENFTGGVGQYQLSLEVVDKTVVQYQPFSVKLRFDGIGNAKLIDITSAPFPESLKIYDLKKEAKFFRNGKSFKEFEFLLIPQQAGELVIPEIQFAVFNPKTAQYETLSTESARIHVLPGTQMAHSKENGDHATAEGVIESEKEETAYHPSPVLEMGRRWVSPKDVLVFWGAVVFLSLFPLGWKARYAFGWGLRKKDLIESVERRFKRINHLVAKEKYKEVGAQVTNAVYFVYGQLSGSGGASVEFGKLLKMAPPSVRRELGERTVKLMESFQALAFAPDQALGDLKDRSKLKKLVAETEELLQKAIRLGLKDEEGESAQTPAPGVQTP